MSPMPVSTRARSQSGTFFTKKEKEAKRKKRVRGGLWKLPQLWKSAEKRGFPQLLGKASQNPLGFPTVTTGPAAVNINHSSLLIDLSHRWGSLQGIDEFLMPNSQSLVCTPISTQNVHLTPSLAIRGLTVVKTCP